MSTQTAVIQTTPVPTTSLGLFANIATSLVIVLLAIFLCLWLMKRFGMKRSVNSLIKIKSSYYLTPKERILLVEVNGQMILVGVTSQQMTVLHTFKAEEFDENNVESIPSENKFAALLSSALKRKS